VHGLMYMSICQLRFQSVHICTWCTCKQHRMQSADLILCERRPLLRMESVAARCEAKECRPTYTGEIVSGECIHDKMLFYNPSNRTVMCPSEYNHEPTVSTSRTKTYRISHWIMIIHRSISPVTISQLFRT